MLDFDTMLCQVGEFGLYQKILFIFQAPFCIFVTFVLFGQVFMVLYPTNYWCQNHFACITIDSVATAEQRRNISFVWRNGGLFRSDPCQLNNINDRFLQHLHRWDKQNCEADRSTDCIYDDSESGRREQWQRDRTTANPTRRRGQGRSTSKPPLYVPNQIVNDDEFSETPIIRRKRHYGSYGSWRDTTRLTPITTTESSPSATPESEFEKEQEGNGRQYGGGFGSSSGNGNERQGYGPSASGSSHGYGQSNNVRPGFGQSNSGRQGYGQSNGRRPGYGESGNGFPRPGNDNDGNDRNPNFGSSNYGGRNPTQREPTTTISNRPTSDGFSGSRPSKRLGEPTDVKSAFAGWPEPVCNRTKFKFILGNNSFILSDRLVNKKYKDESLANINRCKVRWNRSEIPYETIVTEGEWWCNAEFYTTFAQAVFFLGAIVGGFLIGWIADTFGRVPALVIANILGALGGALSAVTTNVWVFSVFRFITGMAFDNCFTMMYILVLEFCGPSYRTLVANLSIAVFYTLGTLLIPLLAFYISNWRVYALVISLPMLLALLALFFVPESARWLLSKGRTKEATNILRNFAKVNRRKVDEKVFVDFEIEATKLFAQLEQEEDEPSLAAAFRTPRLRRTFMLLIIFWAMIALVYDGHSRNIINLANEDLNVFWMFGIASMTEFPADMLLIFTLDRFGRRWLAFGSMTLSGAFSFIAAAVTPEMRTGFLITAIISRFWVNVAFNIGLQYAAELLPTVIRAQGVNAIHIMGYVASIISPFVAAIGRSSPALSLILLGAFALTAGFAALFLAETLGEDLPNTLEEAEEFGKNQSFWNCPICAKEREDEYPVEPPPAAIEESPVVLRNALRGSIRGETYRSSMISQASSSSSRSRRSRYGRQDHVGYAPDPTAKAKNRRITH